MNLARLVPNLGHQHHVMSLNHIIWIISIRISISQSTNIFRLGPGPYTCPVLQRDTSLP